MSEAGSLRFKVEPFHVSINRLSSHSSKQIGDYKDELELLHILLEDRYGEKKSLETHLDQFFHWDFVTLT